MGYSVSDMRHRNHNVPGLPSGTGLLQLGGFVLLCGAYFMWTWSHELGELGGDSAVYLLMAQHFSPWTPYSDVAEHFAGNNPYPPLYPLILGIFGGGKSILVARVITTSLLLTAILVLYAWQRSLDISSLRASTMTLIFALLPGTYLEVLSIHSESLYLLFTLAALASVALFENSKNESLLWVAASCVAAAVLTRSAGVALLIAFMLYLSWHRPGNIWPAILLATLPVVLWHFSGVHAGPGYMAQLAEKYDSNSFAVLSRQIQTGVASMWEGWLGNITTSRTNSLWVAVLGIHCLTGTLYRLFCRKLDAIYVTMYLVLIAVWPFPSEAKRLFYAILPILLVHGLSLAAVFPRAMLGRHAINPAILLYIAIIVLLAAPSLILTVNRYLQPLPEWAARHRQSHYWYAGDLRDPVDVLGSMGLIVETMRETPKLVPENECIYSIKPSVVALYAQRMGRSPPPESVTDDMFREMIKKGGCRYFFLLSGSSPSYSTPLYPLNRLEGKFKTLRVANIADPRRKFEITVAMLIELDEIR